MFLNMLWRWFRSLYRLCKFTDLQWRKLKKKSLSQDWQHILDKWKEIGIGVTENKMALVATMAPVIDLKIGNHQAHVVDKIESFANQGKSLSTRYI